MHLTNTRQAFPDWLTQQWVIWRGKKISPKKYDWLVGAFGATNGIGTKIIDQLAEKENLVVTRNAKAQGLIPSIAMLKLSADDYVRLSKQVIDFYEHTSDYSLDFSVKWKPVFKVFGILLQKIFSNRINQLNIPTRNLHEPVESEIITFSSRDTGQVVYTLWLRTGKVSKRVIYSGFYSVCSLPDGKTAVKSVFPLPNGNATAILTPHVGKKGELILESSGKQAGDPGFYFLLKADDGQLWMHFIPTFRDRLIVSAEKDSLIAQQILTIWGCKVLEMNYVIRKR